MGNMLNLSISPKYVFHGPPSHRPAKSKRKFDLRLTCSIASYKNRKVIIDHGDFTRLSFYYTRTVRHNILPTETIEYPKF
jgi:hypothetical protein